MCMRVRRDCGEVLDNLLRAFRLSGSRLACNKYALVFALLPHIHPGTLCNRKDMWGILVTPVRAVLLYY